MSKSAPRTLVTIAGLAAIYFVVGELGLRLAVVNASATAVWPPTGIAIAALLILGYDLWPAIFIGAFSVNIATAGTVATSLGIASGNTIEALLGAYLVARFARGRGAFARAEDIFKFAFLAGLLSTAASASIGVMSLRFGGLVSAADQGAVWLTWWLGDMAGAIIVAPCLILWTVRPSLHRTRREILHGIVAVSVLMVGGLVLFGGVLPSTLQNYPLAFMCVPLIVWAAFYLRQHEMATAVVALSTIAIWGTLREPGNFLRPSPNLSLLLLQVFMAVIAMTGLVVSAVIYERRGHEEALERAKTELEAKVEERTRQLLQRMLKHERAEADLRELSVRLLHVQDEERRRIARDLHDSTGQLLAALSINLTMLEKAVRKLSPEIAEKMSQNMSLIGEISQEVRTISYLLHPPVLDEMGLASALRWYAEGFEERSRIQVTLEMPEDLDRLERNLETAIFRVVQECLTNIHRHSGSGTASIRVTQSPHEITLFVEDQGRGITPDDLSRIAGTGMPGMGFRGMRERINRFGGEMKVASDAKGTRVQIVIPLNAAAG